MIMMPFIMAGIYGMALLGYLLRAVHWIYIRALWVILILIPVELVLRLVNIIYPI
jgi:hypothetical protein